MLVIRSLNKWIERGSVVFCPSMFPDLIHFVCYFWGSMKTEISQTKPNTLEPPMILFPVHVTHRLNLVHFTNTISYYNYQQQCRWTVWMKQTTLLLSVWLNSTNKIQSTLMLRSQHCNTGPNCDSVPQMIYADSELIKWKADCDRYRKQHSRNDRCDIALPLWKNSAR